MPSSSPSPRPAWQRNLPNALTLARLAMTIAFVAILSVYRFPDTNAWALPAALVLFIVAALTDALDGWLARRWNAISVFGRIMDPFADKVLILGAFVMLAGPQFHSADEWMHAQMSGVWPWMVAIILARELLVTTIRAVLESRGVDFSAALSGKLKMIAQSVCVPLLLLLVIFAENVYDNPFVSIERELLASRDRSSSLEPDKLTTLSDPLAHQHARIESWMESVDPTNAFADAARATDLAAIAFWIALLTTLVTALSAIPYITRAITALRKPA